MDLQAHSHPPVSRHQGNLWHHSLALFPLRTDLFQISVVHCPSRLDFKGSPVLKDITLITLQIHISQTCNPVINFRLKLGNHLCKKLKRMLEIIDVILSLKLFNDKYVRPPFGHQKIETDLRQVPKEFIRLTNILYSFITVQYDSSLLNNKLLLNLIQSFYQLEESYSKSQSEKINSVKDGSTKLVFKIMVCKIYNFYSSHKI